MNYSTTNPFMLTDEQQVDLEARATAVLHGNWRTVSTVPSANLYPFQWLWDSGFIALGWSWIDMDRARLEIQTLYKAQWANGFLPHIIYHDDSAAKSYFPGSDFQGTAGVPGVPSHVSTSGITQPPVLGFVLETLHQLKQVLQGSGLPVMRPPFTCHNASSYINQP